MTASMREGEALLSMSRSSSLEVILEVVEGQLRPLLAEVTHCVHGVEKVLGLDVSALHCLVQAAQLQLDTRSCAQCLHRVLGRA